MGARAVCRRPLHSAGYIAEGGTTIDRRTLLLALGFGTASQAAAQSLPLQRDRLPPAEIIDLWPGGAPEGGEVLPVEKIDERSQDLARYNDRSIKGIARPRMVLFRPAKPTGAAVLITPGGGYSYVVIDKEGYELAHWLSGRGITAFVLFYRLPAEGWRDRSNTPLADAQRAMRLIRHHAPQYGVDFKRIAAMGFSAGGHLCADLATRFDTRVYAPMDRADDHSARPDAAAPIYPVIAMSGAAVHQGSRTNLLGADPGVELERKHSPHLNVTDRTPPCFLLHSEDDGAVPVANTLMLREALKARGVATETHIYPDGGHGFGLRQARGKSVENWPDLFLSWGRYQKIF